MSKRRKWDVRCPLTVPGGIRSQVFLTGGRTKSGRTWWTQRWLDALEEFRIGARLGKGRHYAAMGQVRTMSAEVGLAHGTVQGSDSKPYRCYIRFNVVEGSAKDEILCELKAKPMLVARLLVGEMPPEIEEIFRKRNKPLFPEKRGDIWCSCTCPDKVTPCKHIASVYYLIGDAISTDPLRMLELRGINRNELYTEETAETNCEPPRDDYAASDVTAPLIARLGAIPYWRGEERFLPLMQSLYARCRERGKEAWAKEPLE